VGISYKSVVGKPQAQNHLEDPGVDGETANRILNESGDRMLNGFIYVTLKTGLDFLSRQ
jgi:hypothetical protein